MKSLLLLIVVLLSGFTLHAQTVTDEILNKIPALPKDSCNITKVATEAFQQKVADVLDFTETEIERLNEIVHQKSKGSEEAAKETAMKQMSQQYGLSPEDMAKMQSGKMSAADKKALADKMLQQQTNMSMGEVQNLSKMSEAGKKAYAEAYVTEMMATGQTNQNQQIASNAKKMNQLITEQQAVMGKISASGQKIGNLYASIENDPNLLKSYQNIEKWNEKLMSMTGVDYGQGKQMDSLSLLIQKEQIKICDKYTPKYRAALRQHFAVLKASFPDYDELGRITAELTKMQTGFVLPAENNEVGKLQSVKGYLNILKDAYKFKLYFPEDN
jgi:hypothetical protein